MENFSSDLFPSHGDEFGGLRFRGIEDVGRTPSLIASTYSDESGLSASIEYLSDGEGKEDVPVFVTKAGNKVFIPPSIADLLRDKPPDQTCGGSDFDDEECCDGYGRSRFNNDDDNDYGMVKIGMSLNGRYHSDDEDDEDIIELMEDEEELDEIQVISEARKISSSFTNDLFESPLFSLFWEQFKHVGPKLVPFLKTLGLYFVIFVPEDRPSLFAMTLKCLPIISLALFIVLYGIGLSEEHKFSRRILTGLVFSCLGDAFLIWPSYFLHGMAAFGVAQCFYIRAFGFQPLKWKLGLAVYLQTSLSLTLILPGLMTDAIPICIGVVIYSLLLTTMVWRAIARVEFSESLTWSKMSSCVGATFFAVSDTILALNQFYTNIPYHQTLVMATYYIAQLGIALSVVVIKEFPQKTEDSSQRPSSSFPESFSEANKSGDSVRQRKNKTFI